MVLDSEITRILLQNPTPKAACDRLIQEANRNGGEDNVTAIVVLVE
jgi:serine/threonine protein phosphatase PrpC